MCEAAKNVIKDFSGATNNLFGELLQYSFPIDTFMGCVVAPQWTFLPDQIRIPFFTQIYF